MDTGILITIGIFVFLGLYGLAMLWRIVRAIERIADKLEKM